MNKHSPINQQGFTLMEFLIASSLGLVLVAAIGGLYTQTNTLTRAAQERLDTLQELRGAGTMLVRDARMAGSFGCFSLGRVYSTAVYKDVREDPVNSAQIGYDSTTASDTLLPPELRIQTPFKDFDDFKDKTYQDGGSFGVRTITGKDFKEKVLKKKTIGRATADNIYVIDDAANVLLFTYGVGISGLKSVNPVPPLSGNLGKIVFTDRSNGEEITSTIEKEGFLALSSCEAMSIFSSKNNTLVKKPNSKGEIEVSAGSINTGNGSLKLSKPTESAANQYNPSQLALLKYQVTAYAVGTVGGKGPQHLFRFELGDDGTISDPMILASRVGNISVSFLYTETNSPIELTDASGQALETFQGNCPTLEQDDQGNLADVNAYHFVSSGQYNASRQSPVALQVDIPYQYPKDNTDQHFYITAAIRGGNTCATRRK